MMPKKTFLNLEKGKRRQITEAFLREFAVKPFDEASLSVVIKQLGIAKGSVYQYFKNKQDLFLYLIEECSAVKMKYVGAVVRGDYSDFWGYLRALYEQGYQFDAENPLQSHFLFNLMENLNSPSIKHLYNDMLKQCVVGFESMIKYEIDQGLFRNDISTEVMGFMMYKMGVSIQEHLIFSKFIDPKESIKNNISVYQGKQVELLQTVDDYIRLMKPSFDYKVN